MFRKMRRNKQELSKEECTAILNSCTSGVLAVDGDDCYPYAVPLSYVYHNGKIIFHCAKEGHKLDAVRKNEKASFCVIFSDNVLPEKFTTCYKSVIVFGKIRILDNDKEKYDAIYALTEKYSKQLSEDIKKAGIDGAWNALCMLELSIEHMTGKEAIELTRKRQK